jgi:aromatic-L-amino-acid/L-tryptophan decarboxylase
VTDGVAFPLEPDPEQMRASADAARDLLVEYLEGIADQPSWNDEGRDRILGSLREAAPEEGRTLGDLLARVAEAAGVGFNTPGPGYLAYVPGGGLWSAALADFVALALNRFVGVWEAAPAFVQIEAQVIRWMADLFGLPAEAGGILTSGGSLSNFSAVVTARHALLGARISDGVLYASDQVHASVLKAAVLAGIPRGNVRMVPTDEALRLDVRALREAVAADREGGLRPFCVVASAGTTNTGAVDPIASAGDLAGDEGLWLHVDAAYGGFFQLTERGRTAFAGIDRADSIALDPHKTMFLPYGTGCLLVRDGERLRAAHEVRADYLQDLATGEQLPNFTDASPELSRDFRGLRVWLPIQLHGLGAFREALDEKLDLARLAHKGLLDIPGVEVPWDPELTVVAFRLADRPGVDGEEANRQFLERINASRRVFLSSTKVGGRTFLRVCIVSHRTHRDRIEEALQIIRRAAEEVSGEAG